MSYLTDDEHRILLAALRREKEFCSRQLTDSKRCVAVVQSLERKFQYDRFEQEIRDKAIEEALENIAKAICIGCGYLDGCKCTYKGANCSVSKPMLESVTKALEQMKEVGE